MVTLADIDRPVLAFVGEVDEIAPPPAVRAIVRAAPRAEVYELALRAGHFGLVVGSAATETTWPAVAAWARWRDGEGELPGGDRAASTRRRAGRRRGPGVGTRLGVGLELAAGVGARLARSLAGAASRAVGGVAGARRGGHRAAAAPRPPRPARSRGTRVSLGLLLDEQAATRPDADFFLFEDRAYRHAAAKRRIDNVVRGLLSLGVRQGEHVGVLMGTRPSALAVVAALNRLGAVAVLLRPDGPVEREAELGQVTRIVADPEHAGPRAGGRRRATCSCSAAAARRATSAAGSSTWSGSIPTGSSSPPGTRRTRAGPATSPSSCSPARASAPARTGSPTGAGRCRRSAPPRRRRSPPPTPSTRSRRSTTRRGC